MNYHEENSLYYDTESRNGTSALKPHLFLPDLTMQFTFDGVF